MSVDTHGLLFWGIAFNERERVPWRHALDYDPEEYWDQRLERRLGEAGWSMSDVEDCQVGWHYTFDSPLYYVSIVSSEISGSHIAAEDFSSFQVKPFWRNRLHAFCELMDIPWEEPDWHLVTMIV